jgi:hypothetical protein
MKPRKKGGIKVHAMMDAFSGVAEFVRMTAAKTLPPIPYTT